MPASLRSRWAVAPSPTASACSANSACTNGRSAWAPTTSMSLHAAVRSLCALSRDAPAPESRYAAARATSRTHSITRAPRRATSSMASSATRSAASPFPAA